jgi:hypothetical protein
VHVALIAAIGLAAIGLRARQIAHPAWYEWLVIPGAFCISNAFEWWIHRFVMHRPVKGFMGIYKRHTLAHHQFFTNVEPSFDSSRDFRILFFPPYALVAFVGLSIPPAAILYAVGLPNAEWLLLIALYLNYELFHYCCHVKDDRLARHIPLVNSIRRHHIAHHNTAIMMERNFNLTYPIADWFFGTSDLKCGLLRHVFNGAACRVEAEAGAQLRRRPADRLSGARRRRRSRRGGQLPAAKIKRGRASVIGDAAVAICVLALWLGIEHELGVGGVGPSCWGCWWRSVSGDGSGRRICRAIKGPIRKPGAQ